MKKAKPTYTTVAWKSLDDPDKFRNADRIEEAQKIPLTDSQQVLIEEENKELKDNQFTESWKDKYDLEHRLRQEAETETILIKGIGMNSPEMKSLRSEVAALKQQLHTDRDEYQKNLDKIKKENNDLYNRIAKLTDPVQRARESGL